MQVSTVFSDSRIRFDSAVQLCMDPKWNMYRSIQQNCMYTVSKNINVVEEEIAKKVRVKYDVGLSCGTISRRHSMVAVLNC